MLGRNSNQVDVFTNMIYEKLVPHDHLLIRIDSVIDFSFVLDIVRNKYSVLGRNSCDPIVVFKLLLLEYLYRLSDGEVNKRAKTDIVFRWFLGLNIDDEVPDDTTISYFRINRLGSEGLENIFNGIVKKCIENNLIKTRRFIIDSTDVAANVNYPSARKLICNAFRKTIKEISKFNEALAEEELVAFENEINSEYEKSEKVSILKYCEIAKKHVEYIYLKTYDELQPDSKYQEAYSVLWTIIEQYSVTDSKDRIISCVDPDARVAHKSPGNRKRGYKDHIIVDEDSEIILSSTQTAFNVNDEKELENLIKKAENEVGLKPEELSGDKAYGTTTNRAFLMDNNIKTNIAFYEKSDRENIYFGIDDFSIDMDLKSVVCPGKITSTKFKTTYSKARKLNEIAFYFEKSVCSKCILRDKCYSAKVTSGRTLKIPARYDAVMHDKEYNKTTEFKEARDKRYKVERRFATLVRNHGLRRCRFLKLEGAKIHITLANIACNIVRMVNLIFNKPNPCLAVPKINKAL
jgi:transposase